MAIVTIQIRNQSYPLSTIPRRNETNDTSRSLAGVSPTSPCPVSWKSGSAYCEPGRESLAQPEEGFQQQGRREVVNEPKSNYPTTTPAKVYRGKNSGVNILFEAYGEPSEQAIKNFNRVFNDTLDDLEKRNHPASQNNKIEALSSSKNRSAF